MDNNVRHEGVAGVCFLAVASLIASLLPVLEIKTDI